MICASLYVLLSVFHMIYGIIISVFLAKNTDLKNGCDDVYLCLAIGTFFHFTIAVSSYIFALSECCNNSERKDYFDVAFISSLELGCLAIYTWSFYIFTNISDECKYLWITDAYGLWFIILVDSVLMMLIYFVLASFIILASIAWLLIKCGYLKDDFRHTDTDNHQRMNMESRKDIYLLHINQ